MDPKRQIQALRTYALTDRDIGRLLGVRDSEIQRHQIESPALGGALADDEQFLSRFASTSETHTDEANA